MNRGFRAWQEGDRRQKYPTGQALVGRFLGFARRAADFEPTVRAEEEVPTKSETSLRNVNEHCSLAKEQGPL